MAKTALLDEAISLGLAVMLRPNWLEAKALRTAVASETVISAV